MDVLSLFSHETFLCVLPTAHLMTKDPHAGLLSAGCPQSHMCGRDMHVSTLRAVTHKHIAFSF